MIAASFDGVSDLHIGLALSCLGHDGYSQPKTGKER